MKSLIKFVLAFIGGLAAGLVLTAVGIYLFTDKSTDNIMEALRDIDMADTVVTCITAVVAVLVAGLLQIVIHEGGHLVGGLLSDYCFVSFRVFSLAVIRRDGRLSLHRFSLVGTGGQCLMLPPDGDTDPISVTLYNTGGPLANIIMAIMAAVAVLLCDSLPMFPEMLLLFTALCGGLFAAFNGIPMKLGGISNDGNNILLMHRDKASRKLFINQLRVNAMMQDSKRPKDIPEEWFRTDTEVNYSDPIQASTRHMMAVRLLDMGDTAAAHAMLEGIMEHKDEVMLLLMRETECELLFTSLVLGHTEQARGLFTKELQTYINAYAGTMSSKQRVLCAVALLMDNDRTEAERIYRHVVDNRARYMMQGEVAMDLALLESKHPNYAVFHIVFLRATFALKNAMFNLNENNRIVMSLHPSDMRIGVNDMCGHVRRAGLDPTNGDVYVFVGKSRKVMKLLHWERGGYVMYYKRLEQGRFHPGIFLRHGMGFRSMRWDELVLLMEGISPKVARRHRFERVGNNNCAGENMLQESWLSR